MVFLNFMSRKKNANHLLTAATSLMTYGGRGPSFHGSHHSIQKDSQLSAYFVVACQQTLIFWHYFVGDLLPIDLILLIEPITPSMISTAYKPADRHCLVKCCN